MITNKEKIDIINEIIDAREAWNEKEAERLTREMLARYEENFTL